MNYLELTQRFKINFHFTDIFFDLTRLILGLQSPKVLMMKGILGLNANLIKGSELNNHFLKHDANEEIDLESFNVI